MSKRNGPWTIQSTKQVYHSEHMDVYEDDVTQPDGKPGTYATVHPKPGVAVLPIDDEGQVYLTRQFRYVVGRESLEVASGGREEGEPAQAAAKREIREELGIEAEEWLDLGVMDVDTSIIRSPVALFVARGLTFTETEREGTETIKTEKLPLADAVQRVMDGEITHSVSCVLLLKAVRRLGEAGGQG